MLSALFHKLFLMALLVILDKDNKNKIAIFKHKHKYQESILNKRL